MAMPGRETAAVAAPAAAAVTCSGALARHLNELRAGSPSRNLFEILSFRYPGPVDGHNIGAFEDVLRAARRCAGPVVVHCVTRKGCGYAPALDRIENRCTRADPVDGDVIALRKVALRR